jgi:cytochrome c biogenesis protein CcmG/thiol:disulfide interchange protein DsbE
MDNSRSQNVKDAMGLHNRWHVCRLNLLARLLAGLLLSAGGAHAALAQDALIHKQAPSFIRKDLSGKQVDLSAYRGKVVVLNFWATWCAPCQLEMPRFVAWQKQYGSEGLQILGVSMDDEPGVVRRTSSRLRVNYPVVMGDEQLGTLYGGILGLPVTYLIDRNGQIYARFQGESDLDAMENKVKELLEKH